MFFCLGTFHPIRNPRDHRRQLDVKWRKWYFKRQTHTITYHRFFSTLFLVEWNWSRHKKKCSLVYQKLCLVCFGTNTNLWTFCNGCYVRLDSGSQPLQKLPQLVVFRLHCHCGVVILDNISLHLVCARTKVVKGFDISFNLWVHIDFETIVGLWL